MNHPFSRFNSLPAIAARALGVTVLAALAVSAAAQPPAQSSIAVQREAMQKLTFLAGRWAGPVTINRGPAEPLKLTQTENVEYKLDGLVLLVEGKAAGADGKTQFNALATIAYDDAAHTYHIRAYNAGHYIDTELTVLVNGFSWGFTSGPAKIVNTMHLTAKGEWQETTEVTVGNNPPQPGVEMLLAREP